MKILGLNINHGDSSASLIVNGKIVCFIEEERINRIKHWAGIPISSIKRCLNFYNIKISDIDGICLNSDSSSNIIKKIHFLIANPIYFKHSINIYKKKSSYRNNLEDYLRKELSSRQLPKIIRYNHHKCHIMQAFYCSNFDNAIGLSIDGMGDFNSCVVAKIINGKYDVLKQTFFPNSLGIFYSAFTQYLGFKNYGDEYKVMGLSAYGKNYIDLIDVFIKPDKKNFFKVNLEFFNIKNFPMKNNFGAPKYDTLLSKKAIDLLDKLKKNYHHNFDQDLAFTVQKIYEKYFSKILEYINNQNIKNLVFSGGCAQNSLANRIIKKFNNIENLYIPPVATDSGTGVGAALLYYFQNVDRSHLKIENSSPYLGDGINELELLNFMKDFKNDKNFIIRSFNNDEDLYDYTAELILNNNVIGWYQGRSENGPRALGNRSILANPGNPNIKEIINQKIKRRESFRPFAPSVLEEEVKNYFEKNHHSHYMNIIHMALEKTKIIAPSIVHEDGTSRVQSVSKKLNPVFYRLIRKFFEKSGLPMVLNTSFNENEPIVNSIMQAFECFSRTDMDALIIGKYAIKKNISNY